MLVLSGKPIGHVAPEQTEGPVQLIQVFLTFAKINSALPLGADLLICELHLHNAPNAVLSILMHAYVPQLMSGGSPSLGEIGPCQRLGRVGYTSSI